MKRSLTLAMLALSLVLSGCASTQSRLSEMAGRYDLDVEESQNSNLLMNMVRASFDQPLYFTTIPTVRGNGQVSPNLSINSMLTSSASSLLRIASAATTPGLSVALSQGFGFDMNSLDNSDFVAKNMAPIAPGVLQHYLNQGTPREILLNLFIGKIIKTEGGKTIEYVNDPLLPQYPEARKVIDELAAAGLATQSLSQEMPIGPEMDEADAVRMVASNSPHAIFLRKIGNRYQIRQSIDVVGFCLSAPPSGNTCPPQLRDKDPAFDAMRIGNASYVVQMRSTRGLFTYLGRVIQGQVADKQLKIEMTSDEARRYAATRNRSLSLLTVKLNQPSKLDIARVEYRGLTWSIPAEADGFSGLVLSVLYELQAMNKTPGSVPMPTSVVVR